MYIHVMCVACKGLAGWLADSKAVKCGYEILHLVQRGKNQELASGQELAPQEQ